MITETEYVLIQAHDRQLGNAVDAGQRIINMKNGQLIRRTAQVQSLRHELALERARNTQRDIAAQLAAERRRR